MIRILLFDVLLIACCGFAVLRGGPPERIVGGSLALAYVSTLASYSSLGGRFGRVEQGVLIIDAVLLFVLLAVALRADRAWPLAVAALQLDTVGAHVVKAIDPVVIRVAYALMMAIWSYPMLLLLAVGTFRHRRRLKANGYDLAWTLPRSREPTSDAEVGDGFAVQTTHPPGL